MRKVADLLWKSLFSQPCSVWFNSLNSFLIILILPKRLFEKWMPKQSYATVSMLFVFFVTHSQKLCKNAILCTTVSCTSFESNHLLSQSVRLRVCHESSNQKMGWIIRDVIKYLKKDITKTFLISGKKTETQKTHMPTRLSFSCLKIWTLLRHLICFVL